MAHRTLRLAHRGDWRAAPENSIAALTAALAVPACDGLEFDVRMSSDRVPVLSHDATLERVQGRPERIDGMTAAALGRLGVPTLRDALSAAGRRPFLDVELKGDPGAAVVEVLAAGRGPALENAVVSSFDRAALERVARLAPSWPRWLNAAWLSPGALRTALELGCRAVALDWRAIDERTMESARTAGLEVAAYTVRRRSTYDRLARLGVIAICAEAAALDG
ncbi:MAG: glycerophosphodiester phosphodiesterase [Chloroflexota bacterium]